MMQNNAKGRNIFHWRLVIVPIAIETVGSLGDKAMQFFRDVGRRVAAETGEPRSL
jgi:hypothetical protein